jgi:prolyl-tRNA synthetase
VQVVVVLVRDEEGTRRAASALVDELRGAGHRVRLDERVDVSFGRRAVDWELKGVPVRVEVGPRDLTEGRVTVVRRDRGEKRPIPVAGAAAAVASDLEAAQADLLSSALAAREARTTAVETLDEAAAVGAEGWAFVPWAAVGLDGEAQLASAGLSVRCLRRADGSLAEADDEPGLVAVVGKAY